MSLRTTKGWLDIAGFCSLMASSSLGASHIGLEPAAGECGLWVSRVADMLRRVTWCELAQGLRCQMRASGAPLFLSAGHGVELEDQAKHIQRCEGYPFWSLRGFSRTAYVAMGCHPCR